MGLEPQVELAAYRTGKLRAVIGWFVCSQLLVGQLQFRRGTCGVAFFILLILKVEHSPVLDPLG
jgi:hypothetical protein